MESISAATHNPSLSFVGRIEAVDVPRVQELTNEERPDEGPTASVSVVESA